jgi:UDP-perosamine 4-acetyltransferase
MKKKSKANVILGAGGHAKVILSSLLRLGKKVDYLIDDKIKLDSYFENYKSINEKNFFSFKDNNVNIFLGIGITTKKNNREKIIKKFKNKGLIFKQVIDKDVKLGLNIKIMSGAQIMRGCHIGENVLINQNSIINTMSIIEHDVEIGENSHVAPGSIILGGVKIGKNTFIGAGSIIFQGVKIGADSIIAAGSIVSKNLENKSFFMKKK